jgi:hypothetical protein
LVRRAKYIDALPIFGFVFSTCLHTKQNFVEMIYSGLLLKKYQTGLLLKKYQKKSKKIMCNKIQTLLVDEKTPGL